MMDSTNETAVNHLLPPPPPNTPKMVRHCYPKNVGWAGQMPNEYYKIQVGFLFCKNLSGHSDELPRH